MFERPGLASSPITLVRGEVGITFLVVFCALSETRNCQISVSFVYTRCPQFFENSVATHIILGSRRTLSKFHAEEPQILGMTLL